MTKTVRAQIKAFVYDADDDQAAIERLVAALGADTSDEMPLGEDIMVVSMENATVTEGEDY